MSRIVSLVSVAALLVSSISSPALAEEPLIPVVTAKAVECSARYVKAMHPEVTMKRVIEATAPSIKEMIQPQGSPEQEARFQRILTKVMKQTLDEFTPKFVTDMEAMMLTTFDETEICALTDFYETAVGQSIIEKLPAMSQRSLQLTMKLLPDMQRIIADTLCKEYSCEGTQLANPTGS